MFVVLIDYIAPLPAVESALDDHMAWLTTHYRAGTFLASGRREPRTGGVILAGPVTRTALDAAVADDPFARRGLATHTVVEFLPSRHHHLLATPALAALFS